jgi:hypothetical protein
LIIAQNPMADASMGPWGVQRIAWHKQSHQPNENKATHAKNKATETLLGGFVMASKVAFRSI